MSGATVNLCKSFCEPFSPVRHEVVTPALQGCCEDEVMEASHWECTLKTRNGSQCTAESLPSVCAWDLASLHRRGLGLEQWSFSSVISLFPLAPGCPTWGKKAVPICTREALATPTASAASTCLCCIGWERLHELHSSFSPFLKVPPFSFYH